MTQTTEIQTLQTESNVTFNWSLMLVFNKLTL